MRPAAAAMPDPEFWPHGASRTSFTNCAISRERRPPRLHDAEAPEKGPPRPEKGRRRNDRCHCRAREAEIEARLTAQASLTEDGAGRAGLVLCPAPAAGSSYHRVGDEAILLVLPGFPGGDSSTAPDAAPAANWAMMRMAGGWSRNLRVDPQRVHEMERVLLKLFGTPAARSRSSGGAGGSCPRTGCCTRGGAPVISWAVRDPR